MAFNATTVKQDGIAYITLAGDLDSNAASIFKAQVEQAAEDSPRRLVLLMHDLDFLASAGLRVLIFARQKMGSDVDIYLVGAQEMVLETVRMTGFHHSVAIVDHYDLPAIESH